VSVLLSVILPVFLVIGAGYAAARAGVLAPEHIDGLMRFAQGIALPCLLFAGLARMDLAAAFDPALIGTFYAAATACFVMGMAGARWVFGRPREDAVAIGFATFFSNSLLLGLPITERAFGPDAIASNLAIIAFHSPFCYLVGITTMELARSGGAGRSVLAVPGQVARSMARNPFVVGILLGLAANVTGLPLPGAVWEAMDFIARAGIPAALFGLGGVLTRYRPEGDIPTILFVVSLSLVVQPALAYGLGSWAGLERGPLRSAVVTAAMAPGVNAYLFAAMYGRAMRVAASAVLVGTALTMLTGVFWLWLLR
jgi:malonate transporter